MKAWTKSLIFGLFLFSIILSGNVSALNITTDSCYTFEDNNTYVTLNATITSAPSGCFLCNGYENLTVDCDGYSIIGANYGYAVRDDGCYNITVKNCTITNYDGIMWIRGSTYDIRDEHFYDVNATLSANSASFIYTLFGGGLQNNVELKNVTYDTSQQDYMYYLEGANNFNATHYNVTYKNNNYRYKISTSSPYFYQVDYYQMNITTINASSGNPLPNANVTIIDTSGRFSKSFVTNLDGNYIDFFVPEWFNITTTGQGNSPSGGNPNNITGSYTSFDTNETQFNVVQDGAFLLYMSETIPDVTPPNIIIDSPQNITYYYPEIWFNATMNDTHPDTCLVNYGYGNLTMSNTSGNWNYYNETMTEGTYNAEFFCNDTSGNIGFNSTTFSIDLPPIIYLDSCIDLPRNDTIYKFHGNFSTSVTATCFQAGTTVNVTINCDGYTMLSNNTGGGTEPVFVSLQSVNEFTIRNCNFINFSHIFVNGGSTPTLYVYDTNIQTADHSTPDFLENIASSRNYTVFLINVTHRGTGAGSYICQNDNANMTIYAINSSWSNVNPMYRKYAGSADAYFAIYKMFNIGFKVLQADTGSPISNAIVNLNDIYGNPFTISTDADGDANILLSYYNCSTHGTGDVNFNCGENYYNPYNFTITKSNYGSNSSELNVTSNSLTTVYLTLLHIPIIDQLPSITGQLVITLGFGIMGIMAVLSLLGFTYVTSTGKPDTNTFIKVFIAIVIIIIMIVGVWQGIVLPP
jgi:hypothetical protein